MIYNGRYAMKPNQINLYIYIYIYIYKGYIYIYTQMQGIF